MIYFDNAATSLKKPAGVAEAVYNAVSTMGNSGRGAYEASLASSRIVYEAREAVAGLFHADSPNQVAFTLNATQSLNIAIQGLLEQNDHVITTAADHNSVLRPLYLMEEKGTELSIVPADGQGRVDIKDVGKEIRRNTKAVVCTYASNLTGNLIDVGSIARICADNNILFVLDASQTAGVFPVDIQSMHIDVLCFSGHKGLLGPQGTGGLCVKKGVTIRPLAVGGTGVQTYSRTQPAGMPEALEAGTLNAPGIAGLKAGIEYIRQTGMDTIRKTAIEHMRRFYNGVKRVPGVKIYGDFDCNERCPVVALNIRDYDSGIVSDELAQRYDIAVRAGGHCAPLMHEALGTKLQGAVRFSFSHFNTPEEIDKGIAAVTEIAAEQASLE